MLQYVGADGWIYDVQGREVYMITFADGYRYLFHILLLWLCPETQL